jgi:hypothetical protein
MGMVRLLVGVAIQRSIGIGDEHGSDGAVTVFPLLGIMTIAIIMTGIIIVSLSKINNFITMSHGSDVKPSGQSH